MGTEKGAEVPEPRNMHDRYVRYQKKDSIHEAMEREGFRNVTAVKRTDKGRLLKMLDSYSRGYYKIAIVDSSEIGASPVYLPKPLSSYYVVYIKDTRKQGKEALKEEFEPRVLAKEGERPNAHTGLYVVVQMYAAKKRAGGRRPSSHFVSPTNNDALEVYNAIMSGERSNLGIRGIGKRRMEILTKYLAERGLIEKT